MICKVREIIKKYNMPLNGRTVIAGVSGGADSMAMLNVLFSLKDEFNFKLIVCHLNHSIRGYEADSDESFVKKQCEKLNIECRTVKLNIPEMAKLQGKSEEECGRDARYEFFNSVCENALIATAHTLSDKAETLLFNLTRGASIKGLASIPACRDNIIRPLIECTREDVEKYCAENSIAYVTDKTNSDDNYSRNRIRLNVIPQLKKINPSFEKSVERLCSAVGEDEDYFSSVVDELIKNSKTQNGYLVENIISSHNAVKGRVIKRILLDEAGIVPEKIHIKMIEDILCGGKTEIIKNTFVQVKDGILKINPMQEEYFEWEFDFSELFANTPKGKITAEIINKNDLPPKQIVHNRVLDYGCVSGSLILRNRRAGDKFKTAGNNCTKTLKKLFNEKKIDDRNNALILADDKGIVWVEGIGCCERCKIKEDSKKILLIERVV
ncbi:MAG: tRNA lysidine(34) synthetase TilS [Ruminococcus sp.]|nr:tRNA lysidine(34) synthetase TilS [Candidatus Copronaster equi]